MSLAGTRTAYLTEAATATKSTAWTATTPKRKIESTSAAPNASAADNGHFPRPAKRTKLSLAAKSHEVVTIKPATRLQLQHSDKLRRIRDLKRLAPNQRLIQVIEDMWAEARSNANQLFGEEAPHKGLEQTITVGRSSFTLDSMLSLIDERDRAQQAWMYDTLPDIVMDNEPDITGDVYYADAATLQLFLGSHDGLEIPRDVGQRLRALKDGYNKAGRSALPRGFLPCHSTPTKNHRVLVEYTFRANEAPAIWLYDPLYQSDEDELCPVSEARHVLPALAELAAQRPGTGMTPFGWDSVNVNVALDCPQQDRTRLIDCGFFALRALLCRLHDTGPPTMPEQTNLRTQTRRKNADTVPSLWARLQELTIPTTRVPEKDALGTPDAIIQRHHNKSEVIVIEDSSEASSDSESDLHVSDRHSGESQK